ncbi:MAG: tRNA threonylcarbamoyladenosine dehydratase [Oscillospiraceae bacterium]|nr:tRNA threonylcarbamoyladenosine dehydratase [Oscillospiraceae bacterium]
MKEQFLRTEMALGSEAVEKLLRSHVAVFGIGGVGSYVVEALARAGVGELTLIDHDTVSVSNINRQLIALHSTVGQFKADAASARVHDINPNCAAHVINKKYEAETREAFFGDYDYIADCIDLVACKVDLICTALSRGIPIISALGTGNRLDPSMLRITDISKTEGCPLARVVRKEVRDRGVVHHKVLFSIEPALKPLELEAPPPGRHSTPASVPWVPSCGGLMIAGEIVRDIIAK